MYAASERDPPCCASCKFYRQMPDDELELHAGEGITDELGRCVRNPPTFFYPKLLNGEFPVVNPSMWCGEYVRNPSVPKR